MRANLLLLCLLLCIVNLYFVHENDWRTAYNIQALAYVVTVLAGNRSQQKGGRT